MDNTFEVYLRPLCMDDAEISYKWRNNPEVWKNTGRSPDKIITEEMERAWMRKVLVDDSMKRYAICLKSNDQYIGNIYLGGFTGGRAVEQIFIGETSLWGKGIGTRARALLYNIAKNELGLKFVETHIRCRNIASLKSVQKLGFIEVSHDAEWIKLEKKL